MLAGISWDVLCGFLFCTLLIANFSELRYYNKNPNPRSTHSKWKWLFNWYIFPTCYLTLRGSHLRNWQAMRTPFDFRTNWPVLKSINYWGFFFKQKPNQSWGRRAFWMHIQLWRPFRISFPQDYILLWPLWIKTTLIFCWLTTHASLLLFNKCRKVVLNSIPQINF